MTDVIHQSTAKIASDCLARYKAEVVDEVSTDSAYAQLGTAVHYAIEKTFVALATGDRDATECALEALDDWWAKHGDGCPVWVYAEAETMLRRSYADDSGLWLRLPGRGQKMNVEVSWWLDEDFRPMQKSFVGPTGVGAAYGGRFDILEWGERGVYVRDLKTIRSMPSKDDIFYDFQARVYALAALALFPSAKSVTFELLLLRHGYRASHEFVRGEAWERSTKRWLRAVRSAVTSAHASGEWPAMPGAGCQYCPIRHSCDAYVAAMRQGKVDPVSPEEAALRYLHAKGAAYEYERFVRDAAESTHIPVGIGKVLGFKQTTRSKQKPLADCLSILRADDVTDADIAEYLPTINKVDLETLAKVLLKRGVIECAPYEWAAMFYDEVPSVTFTTFPDDSE